jgi:hypothetical protein
VLGMAYSPVIQVLAGARPGPQPPRGPLASRSTWLTVLQILYVTASPMALTATQKEAVGHDTDVRPDLEMNPAEPD